MTTMPSTGPAELPEPDDWSTLFEGLPVGAFRSLPDGRFVRVNTALARMSGFDTAQELIEAVNDLGVDWFVDPNRRSEILSLLDREGSMRGIVSEIYHQKTRRRIWISENSYVIRDTSGQIACFEGTVEEVTGRVHSHGALENREALLRDVTASVPGVVYRMLVMADGRRSYEFVSEGVRALYGVEPEAVLADPKLLTALRHPDDTPAVNVAIQDHVASGKPITLEFRIRPLGGPQKWVRLISSVRTLGDGSSHMYGVVINITAAKSAEQALRDSERRWRTTLECLGDGVWDWDLRYNECRMTGQLTDSYELPADTCGTPLCEAEGVIHPDDYASMITARQAHLDGLTTAYVHEHRMRLRTGGWAWVMSRGVVVERDEAGRPLRMLGTHTDVTERRQADALRQQRDRAEAADRTKSELMSRISHELRTPLNAILGYAQLLEVDTAPGSLHHEWAGHALSSGRLLLALVEDVLDLTQGQSVQFTLDLQPVPLHSAFEDSWAMLAEQARARDIALQPPVIDPALAMMADPKRMRQVIGNLLSNAVKYNRPGGTISFDAGRESSHVIFKVSDSGRGIAPEYLPRVFQPFDRLGAAHGKVPGTGLGLALCKQLVEAMGGAIEVTSQADVGSTFTVRLPAAN